MPHEDRTKPRTQAQITETDFLSEPLMSGDPGRHCFRVDFADGVSLCCEADDSMEAVRLAIERRRAVWCHHDDVKRTALAMDAHVAAAVFAD